jgi:hypothetical protein
MSSTSSPIVCHIECGPFSAASSQIFTGFALLSRAGHVDATVRRSTANWRGQSTIVAVVLGDGTRLIYDLLDAARIRPDALDWSDHYFKRSYAPSIAPEAGDAKVAPLGFNYPVYASGDWLRKRMVWNATNIRQRGARNAFRASLDMSETLSRLARRSAGRAYCAVSAFEALPSTSDPPRVLLLTRTWDPEVVQQDAALAEAWAALNRNRAACIRLLRREFGPNVVSGFAPTPDAIRDYGDCVVDEPRVTRKTFYLELMRRSDVCVATTGLAGSNGWRLGEYIAASRSIVSERLLSQVPGGFTTGTNYSAFVTPEECVEHTVTLVGDRELRLSMMKANHRYYEANLRPDMLVAHSLSTAASGRS